MAPVAAFFAGAFGWGTAAAWGAGAAATAFGAGAALGGTILGKLAVKLLTSVALSALQMALAPSPSGGGLTIAATLRGEDNPETIILGRYATSGQCVYVNSHGKSNRYLTHVVELCSAPGATLSRLILGDKWVTLGTTAHPEYGLPVLGDYEGHVWLRYYDGRQTAADPDLVAKYSADPDMPWASTAIGAGLCYAVMTFHYDQEDLPQVPSYRFELDGLPLYDIRKDTTAGGSGSQRLANPATWTQTNNPIVQTWNVLRGIPLPGGEIYGGGYDLSMLPPSVWMAAMNRCDVAVAIGSGGTEPAYRAGLECALTQEPAQHLTEILKACSATIADMGYAWTITVGAPGLPVYSFTDDDVIVSKSQTLDPFPSLSETYNAVSARYPAPGKLWETREAPLRKNAAAEASDAFGRRTASLTLPAVPYARQVQRLTAAWLADGRRFVRHILNLPADSSAVELTDTVDWTSPRNGYSAKIFSVSEISEDVRTGIRQMSLRERNPADYDWTSAQELPEPPDSTATTRAPEAVAAFAASGVSITDSAGQARRPAIQISWDPELTGRGLRWQIRFAGQTTVRLRGDTQRLDDGVEIVSAGVLPARNYEVRVRLIKGRKTAWSDWLSATTPDVRLGAGDVDVPAVTADVTAAVTALDAWSNEGLAGAAQRYRTMLQEIAAIRDNVTLLQAQGFTRTDQARQRLALATAQSFASVEQSLTVAVSDIAALSQYAVTLAAEVAGKASAGAVAALTTRVSTAEGQITAQSTAITDLTAAVGTKASAASVSALTTRVTDAEDVNTAQATAITNLNTSLSGKANASALTALETRVTDAEGINTSQATQLTTLNTSVGNVSASGLFAVEAVATPAGAQSRIALKARATAGEARGARTAAMYLEAVSGGTSRVILDAGSVAILNGTARVAPFVVTGSQVFLGNVKIRSAEITGDMIVGGAVSATYPIARWSDLTVTATTEATSVAVGSNVVATFAPADDAVFPTNPVEVSHTLLIAPSAATSGRVTFALQQLSGSTWSSWAVWSMYHQGATVQPAWRGLGGTGWGLTPLGSGTWRLRCWVPDGPSVTINRSVLTMRQLNK